MKGSTNLIYSEEKNTHPKTNFSCSETFNLIPEHYCILGDDTMQFGR